MIVDAKKIKHQHTAPCRIAVRRSRHQHLRGAVLQRPPSLWRNWIERNGYGKQLQLSDIYFPNSAGCSHGKWGFDEFTHKRSVIDQDSLIKRDGPIPPFPHPGWLYDVFLRASVKGFVPRAYRGAVSAATKLSVLCVLLLAVKKIMNA